ncbi:MAG: hypothetical protein H6657_23600 [Ardenticatenaceae bacterium]|nr:hypothetical protein [Anaerolineales bacterium]MCB8980407.1 hypothetical protein [Ardenticatenaceae bacterium]
MSETVWLLSCRSQKQVLACEGEKRKSGQHLYNMKDRPDCIGKISCEVVKQITANAADLRAAIYFAAD